MNDILGECLDDLAARIDERQEQRNLSAWLAFLDGKCMDKFFVPPARKPAPPRFDWPTVSLNAACASDDVDLMVLHQLRGVSDVLATGGSAQLCVRCNYGTGIMPSLFGCGLFWMDESLNTLPAAIPLASRDAMVEIVRRGVPDIHHGLGGKVFRCGRRFAELLRQYPLVGRYVALYHPDVQGPVDIAEVTWGSDIFYAFCDDTELLRSLLSVVTETYVAFMREWFAIVPPQEPSVHWGLMHRGPLMLRNDSLMNLSPAAYADIIRPFDQRLLDEFGGGAIHFCGRGDHYIEAMSALRGLTAINMSQPDLNDMEVIYRNTVDKGIAIIGLDRAAADRAGRPLRGKVMSW